MDVEAGLIGGTVARGIGIVGMVLICAVIIWLNSASLTAGEAVAGSSLL